jgi:hypothetical protein
MTVSAAWGETLTFRFQNLEGLISAGTFASLEMTVTSANIADGTTFILAGQTFTANNATPSNTDVLVNLNQGDALKHAQNLQGAILSNSFFAGRVSVTYENALGDYIVRVNWLSRGNQFPAGSTMPAPYTMDSEVTGTDVELTPGYALVYQVWMNDGGVDKPITDFRAVTPQITVDQEYGTCEFEVNDALRPYLKLDLPFGTKNTVALEFDARKRFWILYGWRDTIKENGLSKTVFHDLKQTEKEYVVYAALQEQDRFGMRLYFSGGDAPIIPEALYMTKRPHFNVDRDSIGWLYAIMDIKERLALPSVEYVYCVDRWDGAAWVSVSFTTMGTVDGIYRVPAHPKNLPTALSSGVTRYRTEIRADVSGTVNTYASQVWDIGNCEKGIQVYFLGDLCAFEDFTFNSIVEEDEVVDMEIALVPIRPFDNDSLLNYGTRLSTGGRAVVNTKNFRRFTGLITAICDLESFRVYLESFLKSPLKYVRFKSETVVGGSISTAEIQRSIFIDPGSINIYSDGDTVDATVSFYFHKDLNVQL